MSTKRISDKAGWVDSRKLPKGPNGRALCRWCSREVPPRRKTFCSAECVHQHKLRTRPAYVRTCLAKRDRGVCAICGLDTHAEALRLLARRPYRDPDLFAVWRAEFERRLGITPYARKQNRYWDADHIHPVAEGGGTCGLDNYQTLCLLCHKTKTAEQKRRASGPKQELEMSKEKPTPKEMQQALKAWMSNEDNNPHRLVSAAKLAEMAKAMDPEIRGVKGIHNTLVREIAMMVKKAMLRCYDNKRATLRDSDL